MFKLDVRDPESCEKAVQYAVYAIYFSAAMTFIVAVVGMVITPSDPTLRALLDPWLLLDVGLLLILSIFVKKKSRFAISFLLIYFVIGKIFLWAEVGAPKGLIVAILFFIIYLNAARAIFAWPREDPAKPTDPQHAANLASSPTGGERSLLSATIGLTKKDDKPQLGMVPVLFLVIFAGLGVRSLVALPGSVDAHLSTPHPLTLIELGVHAFGILVAGALIMMILKRSASTSQLARFYLLVIGLHSGFLILVLDNFAPAGSETRLGVTLNMMIVAVCIIGYGYWIFHDKLQGESEGTGQTTRTVSS